MRALRCFALSLFSVCGVVESALGQGAWVSTAGPVNRSMGGASVAAPIDSIGAIYWNPASISGMDRSQTSFGLDLLWSNQTVETTLGPFTGSTDSDNGTFPIPNIGWVYKTGIPSVTLGVGLNAVSGFKTNLPADPNNLALAPAPNGLGSVNSEAQFFQIAPVLSYAVNDRLSVAVGPTITTGQVQIDPFVFASANANGSYANGRASKYHWGGGFQVGTYYIVDENWRLGSSFKSTSWMETFEFMGEDANGLPRTMTADIDLPMIVSVGTSYVGFEDWLIAFDVRYFDYEGTAGFGDRATFSPTGQLGGLDWSSIVASSLGVQHKLSQLVTIRGGYTYNQNPIKNSEAFYNIASPLVYEHMLSTGASLTPNDSLAFNVAYSYMLENAREGQLISPALGPIPGSTFRNTMDAHFLSFGISVLH